MSANGFRLEFRDRVEFVSFGEAGYSLEDLDAEEKLLKALGSLWMAHRHRGLIRVTPIRIDNMPSFDTERRNSALTDEMLRQMEHRASLSGDPGEIAVAEAWREVLNPSAPRSYHDGMRAMARACRLEAEFWRRQGKPERGQEFEAVARAADRDAEPVP